MAAEARDYELVVILNPEIGDDIVGSRLEWLSQAISSRGGEVVDTSHWGRRRLAYPIKRHAEGNYVVTQLRLDPSVVPALEDSLRISEDVIRHLIIRSDEA